MTLVLNRYNRFACTQVILPLFFFDNRQRLLTLVHKEDLLMSYCGMPEHFFTVHFLGDILSEKSKRELRVLDISGYGSFEDKWMEAVRCFKSSAFLGKKIMFPKLEVSNLSRREFSSEDFAIFCKNLPNLQTLRIGHHSPKTLNGISKLTNLTNLTIDTSVFSDKKDVEELSKLKSLKFSASLTTQIKIWKKILPKLSKLQVVVANDTKIHGNVAPPSVTVFIFLNHWKPIRNCDGYPKVLGNISKLECSKSLYTGPTDRLCE